MYAAVVAKHPQVRAYRYSLRAQSSSTGRFTGHRHGSCVTSCHQAAGRCVRPVCATRRRAPPSAFSTGPPSTSTQHRDLICHQAWQSAASVRRNGASRTSSSYLLASRRRASRYVSHIQRRAMTVGPAPYPLPMTASGIPVLPRVQLRSCGRKLTHGHRPLCLFVYERSHVSVEVCDWLQTMWSGVSSAMFLLADCAACGCSACSASRRDCCSPQ